jgi:hypothetical protein
MLSQVPYFPFVNSFWKFKYMSYYYLCYSLFSQAPYFHFVNSFQKFNLCLSQMSFTIFLSFLSKLFSVELRVLFNFWCYVVMMDRNIFGNKDQFSLLIIIGYISSQKPSSFHFNNTMSIFPYVNSNNLMSNFIFVNCINLMSSIAMQ